MPFMYKDGRFHFLFLNTKDDYLSDSLHIMDWKQWTWLQTYHAGYKRALFILPSKEGMAVVDDYHAGISDKSDAVKATPIDRIGQWLGKFDRSPKAVLESLDEKRHDEISFEEVHELIQYVVSSKSEVPTVLAIPIRLFYDLYADKSNLDGLCSTLSSDAHYPMSDNKGSIFVLTASLEAEESLPYLKDKNGVFGSSLFPEFREYVWSTAKPGSFYKRMQDAFTRERMVCKDPVDRETLYRLLLYHGYVRTNHHIDLKLLGREADSLFVLLHGKGWRRELDNNQHRSTCIPAHLSPKESLNPLRFLLEIRDAEGLLRYLKETVDFFDEKHNNARSIFSAFGIECPSRMVPEIGRKRMTEFEVFKQAAVSYGTILSSVEKAHMLEKLDRLERFMYVPWENGFTDEEGIEAETDPCEIPDEIKDAITKCTEWMEKFREYSIPSYDNILKFPERFIIRKSHQYQKQYPQAYYDKIENMYTQLVDVELSAEDASRRLKDITLKEDSVVDEIRNISVRMKKIREETGNMDVDLLSSKVFLTMNEKEYLTLAGNLSLENEKLERVRKLRKIIQSEVNTRTGARDEMLLLLAATERENVSTQNKKLADLINDLKNQMVTHKDDERRLRNLIG